MRNRVIHVMGLAAACLAAGGCAQCASVLGDRPPVPHRTATAPRRVQTAAPHVVPTPAAHRVESSQPRVKRSAVVQASAIEPAPSNEGACDTCCGPCEAQTLTYPLCPLAVCGAGADCIGERECSLSTLFAPGPQSVRYMPPMPPKFLPVPTQPTLSPARPEAPDYRRGDVEVGYRSQMTFPGSD